MLLCALWRDNRGVYGGVIIVGSKYSLCKSSTEIKIFFQYAAHGGFESGLITVWYQLCVMILRLKNIVLPLRSFYGLGFYACPIYMCTVYTK